MGTHECGAELQAADALINAAAGLVMLERTFTPETLNINSSNRDTDKQERVINCSF